MRLCEQAVAYGDDRRRFATYRLILVRMVSHLHIPTSKNYLKKVLSSLSPRTTEPSVHWIVPILAGIPFGAGFAQILQGLVAYLMDAYATYFASAVAATIVMRSACAAAFPLFSPVMFAGLGDQWACSVFAFLSLICMPMPVLFWVSAVISPDQLILTNLIIVLT